jgi:hypothetical protein
MGNPKAREFLKRQEMRAAWNCAETRIRELAEDICIPGVGLRRIQLVYAPSFEAGYSWDLRVLDHDYRLFVSQIIVENGRNRLSGYQELHADVAALKGFMERLRRISLPIEPDFSGGGGLDGTLFQFALIGDLHSEIRFQWWSEFPAHWRELVGIADEMIASFIPLHAKSQSSML